MALVANKETASLALAGAYDEAEQAIHVIVDSGGGGGGTSSSKVLGADGTTEAKVAATTAIAVGDNALAVHDPVLGVTTGAAVITDANGTIQQYLRGIVSRLVSGITLVASELHIGQVGGHAKVFPATAFVCDTSAYSSGDVLTDALEFDNAVRVNDGTGLLTGFTLIDEDDQGVAMDIYVMDANVSLGTKNSAPSISDTNARNILGVIPVATTDWKDLGGVRVAYIKQQALQIVGGTGTKKIWLAAVNGTGTPTFTASGLRIRPFIIQD